MVVLLIVGGGVGAFLLTQDDDDDDGGGGGGGRDSETPEGQEYVDALVAAGLEEEAPFEETDLRCLSTAVVDVVGVSRLQESVTPDEIRARPEDGLSDFGVEVSETEATEIYEQGTNCGVDFRELLLTALSESGATEDDVACVSEAVDEDLVRRSIIAAITQDEDASAQADEELGGILEDCGLD